MIYSNPGMKRWYPSTVVSKYYVWFVEMGYPNLDIMEWPDGEWAIIEYRNAPIIPSLTKWQTVLSDIRNVEISKSFIEHYVGLFDMHKRSVWDLEELKSREVDEEHEAGERHAEDIATRWAGACSKNPALVERVAKNGVKEILPWNIQKHVPRQKLIGEKNAP